MASSKKEARYARAIKMFGEIRTIIDESTSVMIRWDISYQLLLIMLKENAYYFEELILPCDHTCDSNNLCHRLCQISMKWQIPLNGYTSCNREDFICVHQCKNSSCRKGKWLMVTREK